MRDIDHLLFPINCEHCVHRSPDAAQRAPLFAMSAFTRVFDALMVVRC
jgi:hypothetical protein